MNDQKTENTTNVQMEKAESPELKACTFNVGGQTFSIPLLYVKEITEAGEIFPLPLTPAYVEGIFHFRGSAIPVLSISKIKNIPEEHSNTKQLIILDLGGDKLGIAVNEMPDLKTDISGELLDVQKIYKTYRIKK
jgi:purine-binding chemotaxis protein CheW